ncbi:LytR C-terminal domain-containing protein [Nocardioides zeae]|uniref:LytR C-terminal domain-containing protein n=1 Tax=Nocardioides imazamoxiresistens TaxID=3231893 RepID=A0ABU3PW29_9ACTN|nr:LytR C-terminal domain-containing protein [Nocardioides zeae]MDT9593441.1 LytR C-terminal domain-containing protein [Nocardioides zeae]
MSGTGGTGPRKPGKPGGQGKPLPARPGQGGEEATRPIRKPGASDRPRGEAGPAAGTGPRGTRPTRQSQTMPADRSAAKPGGASKPGAKPGAKPATPAAATSAAAAPPREGLSRRARSNITVAVLVAVLLFFFVWGWSRTTAPLPEANLGSQSTDICTVRDFTAGDALTPADVAVSVYNASGRSQLAQQTMTTLTQSGFVAGRAGNAPEGMQVDRVEIRARNTESAAVQLVRGTIGDPAVVVADPEVDGIAIYLGPSWNGPTGQAQQSVTVNADESVCGPPEAELP